jgi:hypothetical protein
MADNGEQAPANQLMHRPGVDKPMRAFTVSDTRGAKVFQTFPMRFRRSQIKYPRRCGT